MAGEDAAAVSTGATAARKTPKVEYDDDDDELDNVPLAVSRGKKASNASASKVKKEDDEDDSDFDNKPIANSRAKKGNEKQKIANAKASKVKKEENDSDDDFKKKSGRASASARTSKVKKIKDEDLDDVKGEKKMRKRVSVKDKNAGTAKEDKVKKERKVYDLPGQKHDPPEEGDSLRIFYESLYEQIPTSDMAATWLMEWGLLPLDVAKNVFEKKQGQKIKSPVKTTSAKRMPTSPAKKATPSSAKKTGSTTNNTGKTTSQKKRKASSDSDDDDDDFVAPKWKTKRQRASN